MMVRIRIACKSRGLVLGLLFGRTLGFDDDWMPLNWGHELMMVRIRIACKSRGLVLGFLLGRILGFDDDCMPLNLSV